MKWYRWGVIAVAIVAAACSDSTDGLVAATGDRNATIDSVTVDGPLKLAVRDMPLASATVPFPAASISATAGSIVAANSEYGSLCRYDVTGTSDIRGGKIGIHVLLNPRLTVCTADVRVLQHTSTLTIAPGTYDVVLVRELNNAPDTLARQSITVR